MTHILCCVCDACKSMLCVMLGYVDCVSYAYIHILSMHYTKNLHCPVTCLHALF